MQSDVKRQFSDTIDNGNTIIEPHANILNKPGVIDPNSGRVLTIGEAIQSRILDVRTGEIVVNHERISIEEAIKRNLIDASLANSLLEPGAAYHAGKPISLLEVIQREISEAENGYDSTEKRIKVITTTTHTSSSRNANDDDDDVGAAGYTVTHTETVKIKPNELCLSDAIVHGLVDTSGWVMDRNSGDKFRLDSAISNGLINPNIREIVDAKNDCKITIQQALDGGILNAKTGRYMQNVTKEKLTFIEAKNRQLIGKPLTLKDVCDLNLLEKNGTIISPTRRNKLSILDAINVGVLDKDTIKSVTKTKDEKITLAQALSDGIILSDSKYRDAITQEEISIPEAVERGLISSVSQRSIFNIDGFKDPFSNDFVSLNVALNKQILHKKDGQYQLDTGKGKLIPLDEGHENGLVRSEFYEMINRPIGVFDATGKQLTVLDLVYYDLIDPKSGFLLHPKTKAIVPLDHAIESKLITPEGALLLSSLLNITLTTETVTKTIRRYVTITDDVEEIDPKSQVETILTFTEAVRLGYIDEKRQLYTDPNTGNVYSIQQALNYRFILPDSSSVNIPKPTARSTITLIRKSIEPEKEQLKETIQKTKTIHKVPIKSVTEISPAPKEYSTFHTETKVEKKLDTKTITTDFLTVEQKVIPMQATEHFLEIPPEGWLLSTAIENRLFDPLTGLFHITATDRLVSFEECIQLEIINPDSVSVIDPTNGRKITVKRSFEKRILDPLGNYKKKNKNIGMKQAIDSGLIILEDAVKVSPSSDKTTIHFIHDSNKPDTHVLVKSRAQSQEIPSPEPVQLVPGIIYDPSTALVIFTETGQSETILSAVEKGLVDENMVKIIDPKTGTPLTVKEAIESKIVDLKTGHIIDAGNNKIDLINASKLGLLAVIGSPLVAAAGAIESLKFILDPKTGQQIPYEIAYERGLISREELLAASPSYSPSHTAAETKYTVTFGRSPSSPESKPIVLQKMRKKIVKPKDAVAKGLIDAKTAELFETKGVFLDENGDVQSLLDVVKAEKIEGESGEIIDPQRGDVLTINKAIERGILDADGTNQILVPLNKSLSIAQLKEQGLIDPKSLKIIHPETGNVLNLREAIICEIVDPLSHVVDPHTNQKITLQKAIEKGVVDDENCLVRAKQGTVDLLTAITQKVFPIDSKVVKESADMPPLGMTLAVAIKRGTIDSKTKEFVHPITGKRVPLLEAIENNTIMALPYTPNVDSISISDAIDSNLIDFNAGTVKNPNNSEVIPISEAIENGLLVVKPLPELLQLHSSGPHTSVTETVTSYHTITTKMVELLSGYVLVSPNEVKHLQTGQILSIEEAKEKGVIKDESQTSQQFATREIKVNFSDAIRRGLVDIKAGTYTDPSSGAIMPIQQAVSDGILETDDKSDNESEGTPKTESMTLSEAVETIFDEKTKKFRDPKNPKRMVTFTDAMNEGIIDSKSVVFDVRSGKAQTLEDGVKVGLIDAKTGEVKQSTGKKVNVKEAAKLGLMAVVGAPILAGMAVADAVKSITKKSDKPDKPSKAEKSKKDKTPKVDKATKPEKIEKVEIKSKPDKLNKVEITVNKPEISQTVKITETIQTKSDEPKVELPTKGKPVKIKTIETIDIIDEPTKAEDSAKVVDIKPSFVGTIETVETISTPVKPGRSEKSPEKEKPSKEKPSKEKPSKEKPSKEKTVEKETSTDKPDVGKIEKFIEFERAICPVKVVEPIEVDQPTVETIETIESTSLVESPVKPDRKSKSPEKELVEYKKPEVAQRSETPGKLEKPVPQARSKLTVQEIETEPEQSGSVTTTTTTTTTITITTNKTEEIEKSKLPAITVGTESSKDIVSETVKLIQSESLHHPELVKPDVSTVSIVTETTLPVLRINETLTPEQLELYGVFDKETESFINPETQERIPFYSFIYDLNLFEPSNIYVKDLSENVYEPFEVALEKPLIDKNSGHMVDSKTGQRVPFFECARRRWILEQIPEEDEEYEKIDQIDASVSTEAPLKSPGVDSVTEEIEPESIVTGIKTGTIRIERLLIRSPITGQAIPMSEAVDLGIVDLKQGVIINPKTKETIEFSKACDDGILITSKQPPISLEAVVIQNLYEPIEGVIFDISRKNTYNIREAIDNGIINPEISLIKDQTTNEILPLNDALNKQLVLYTGKVKRKNDLIPLNVAYDEGLIQTKPINWDLLSVLIKQYYSPKTGTFLNPKTGNQETLHDALKTGWIDASSVLVKDEQIDDVLPMDDAIKSGLVDVERGVITRPELSLDDAMNKGYLLSANKPYSLADLIIRHLYDPMTGLLTIDGVQVTLENALKDGLIHTQDMVINDPRTGEIITLLEAIRRGIIDPRSGIAIDLRSGLKLTLIDAFERGILIQSKRQCTLPDAVFKGIYDPKSGKFSTSQATEKLSAERAIRRGIIDAQSTIVNVKGRVLPFELAAESGIVDIRRGMVLDDYDNKIDFREAFDRGILIEVKKPISLCETMLKGLYDEQTGLFMDPKSGKRLTITKSLGRNLIDPNSVQMKDLSTGLYRPISLIEATQTGLIDGQNALILIGNRRITLREAFDLGLLTDTNAPISIQRAIHQGLYDSKTGKIHDTKSGRKITLLEAIRKFNINPQLPCYFNEHEEALLSLGETCRARLIDRREGVFKEPGSDVFIPLNEAMALGLIVDIENASFGLYEVIAMGLYDRNTKQIIHPVNNRRLSLHQACEEDLVSPIASLVKDTTTGKYLKLNEAITAQIINDKHSVYVLSKLTIDLHEARKQGLIVSNQKLMSIEKAVKMKLLNVNSGKFIDPALNVPFDLQESISNQLIDGETTVFKNFVTGQYKPLKQAIAEGDIDVTRGKVLDPKSKLAYTYDVALEKGLLVTIDRPITGRSIRHDSIDLTMSPVSKTPREMTLREAIRYEIINPETSVFKDPVTSKFKALKHIINHIDPEIRALVDPKSLFFVFDKTFVIYTREPISFEYAVESKQLNLSTGKFVDSLDTTKKEHLLKDAIGQGFIDPESALIKDGAKHKLLRLPEAYRKGLVDAEKANVVDSMTSKLYTLQTAYDNGLLITTKRSFGLLEAISYHLYNTENGKFSDPFGTTSTYNTVEPSQQPQMQSITLNDAIASGLIDPTTTVVRDTSNSTIIPLHAAIALNIIDPTNGQLIKSNNEKLDLVKAQEKGFLLPAEQRVSCYCDNQKKNIQPRYFIHTKYTFVFLANNMHPILHLPLHILFDVVFFLFLIILSYSISFILYIFYLYLRKKINAYIIGTSSFKKKIKQSISFLF